MPVADLADTLEVAGRGREAPARVLHGLQEDRRHGVGSLAQNRRLNFVGGPATEGGLVVGVGLSPVEVRVRHLDRAGHQGFERRAQVGDTCDGERSQRRPVVGDVATDDLRALWFAGHPEVLACQLPRRLHRLRASRREEDAVEVTGRVRRDAVGQLNGPRVGVGPQREVGQRAGLLRPRLGQFGPTVPDLAGEEPGKAVEVFLAVLVPHVGALTAHDHRDFVVLVPTHPAEVHPEVSCGLVAQPGCLDRRIREGLVGRIGLVGPPARAGARGGSLRHAYRPSRWLEAPLTACPTSRSAWPASGTRRSPSRAHRESSAPSR